MSVKTTCCAGKTLGAGQKGGAFIGDAIYPISVPIYDSLGNLNTIPDGTVLDKTYIETMLNNSDYSKRWTVYPKMIGLEAPESQDNTVDIEGVAKSTGAKIKQPITYYHSDRDASPALEGVYRSNFSCRTMGVFWITRQGNLVGINDGEGYLRPIELDVDTVMANYKDALREDLEKVMVSMVYADIEDKSCLDYVDACNIEYPASKWVKITPMEATLKDVSADALGLDTFTITANLLGSGFGSKLPATITSNSLSFDNGTTPATVYNRTTSASSTVVLTAVGNKGEYTAVLGTAPTAADEIVFQISENGLAQATELVAIAKA